MEGPQLSVDASNLVGREETISRMEEMKGRGLAIVSAAVGERVS